MNRVVVTGFGSVTPVGATAEESWKAITEGVSGIGPITLFDATNFPIKIAAEVKNFDPGDKLDRKEVRRQDRFELMAQIAAMEALEHSGIDANQENPTRIGVVVSSGVGGMETLMDQIPLVVNEGPRKLSPFAIPRIMSNGASGLISIAHGFRGPTFSVASACASASDGIGVCLQFLRAGIADVMVSGGSETGISLFGVGSFYRIGAYTPRLDRTPSPFSRDRDGLVMGEGSAVLVMETLDHAKARGAHILGEIAGYGASADAFHVTAPTEDGSGSASAIDRALKDAKLDKTDVDYINAHGTGTPLNDGSETLAIKQTFGEQAYNIPISSTKSMTGHCMGATASLEAVFCLQAIRDGIIPPTINYNEPDELCDLDYVPNEARKANIRTTISHAFGFGGHNSVLVIRKFEG
jgi:beta-ketoacyl-acyl-carrier-protein synthase II